MKDNLTQISIVLDRSGSMSGVREATVEGLNSFIEEQKKAPGDANFTLVQFDTQDPYEVVFDKPIKEVKKLTKEDFRPRGGTPLYDAIGNTVSKLGDRLRSTPEQSRPSKVVVVIITDGQENSSFSYSSEKIAEMIEHQRGKYAWEFVFLGANQDAILTAKTLNISIFNASTFDPANTGLAYAYVSRGLTGMRSGLGAQSLNFSNEQRAALVTDEDKVTSSI